MTKVAEKLDNRHDKIKEGEHVFIVLSVSRMLDIVRVHVVQKGTLGQELIKIYDPNDLVEVV